MTAIVTAGAADALAVVVLTKQRMRGGCAGNLVACAAETSRTAAGPTRQ
jgi:hypothetical protein